MKVKNYYKMSEDELVKASDRILNWLFEYPKHPARKKALFAFSVANDALSLERDSFTKLLIKYLT